MTDRDAARLPLVLLARRALVALLGALLTEFASATALRRRSRARPGTVWSLLRRNPAGRADGVAIRPSALMDALSSLHANPFAIRVPGARSFGRTARQGKPIPIETPVESCHRAASEARTLRFTRCPRPRQ